METVQQRLRFADFEVDLRARELSRQGVRVRLQDQPFQILAMLLARRGDVVTRDELRAGLWPEGTFVDFEHSLNAAIKRLRVALGDTAENPRFVETLHRRGYRFIAAVNAPAHTYSTVVAQPRAAADGKRRLVVLPFSNLGEAGQDYFIDGLTEEMIAAIGRRCAGHIGVLGRTSSWLYKDVTHGAGHIGEALRVDYLVEGSVRRDGDRARITAKLIETCGETQLWAETYDRGLEDMLAVQADVASHIAQALALELLPSPTVSYQGTRSSAAYQAFLRGRYYWNISGDDGLEEAVRYYDQAIQLDGEFAKAYAARARAAVSFCEYYRAEPIQALERAKEDALRAIELDGGDADALVALGEVHRVLDWNWAGAEAAYLAALKANPNSESTHKYYALFLAARGRMDAMPIADRGWDLDPLCSSNNTAAATVRFFAGDYEASAARCRVTLEMDPTFGPARRRLASALAELGQFDEAIAEFNLISSDRLDPVSRAWLGYTLAVAGNTTAARAVATSLEQAVDGQSVPPFHMAILYAGLDDRDRAFAALDRACLQRDPWLDSIEVEPRFRRLRNDARYADLLSRLNLSGRIAAVT